MGAAVQRTYSTEEVEAGLLELACWRGNARRASRELAKRGLEIPFTTLDGWKRQHASRLAEVEAEVLPEIRSRLAVEQEQIAQESARVTKKILRRLYGQVDKIPARDLAGAARNTEVTAATAIDKHSILHGLPTEIRQHESADDVLKRLQAKHPGMFVDASAEEIHDADVVEQEPERRAERQLPRTSTAPNVGDAIGGDSSESS